MKNNKCGETHTTCQARLDLEGGKARCCYCAPHEGCTLGMESKNKPAKKNRRLPNVIINGSWDSPSPYKVDRWAKKNNAFQIIIKKNKKILENITIHSTGDVLPYCGHINGELQIEIKPFKNYDK